MRVTRRNTLVLLGVLTIAGGALFGTGAFTQVSADRTVTAETAGDSSAYLTLEGDGNYVSESGDGTIEFQFDSLNENATSEFGNVLNVTANPADSSGPYDLYVESTSGLGSGAVMDVQDSAGNSVVGAGNTVSLTNGGTQSLTVVFDTNNGDVSAAPGTITIVASEQ